MTSCAAIPIHSPGLLICLWRISKPRLSALVLFTAGTGLVVGPNPPAWHIGLAMVLLTSLLVGTANAMNCVIERNVDALMLRTRTRPLPAGHMDAMPAVAFSILGACASIAGLYLITNMQTALWGAVGYVSYVALYTPLKQKTPWAVVVGAVPGAVPPVMGWCAAGGTWNAQGASLFALLFVWQLPHFLAIALCERQEYERAGIAVLPVSHGLPITFRAIRWSAWITALAMLAPHWVGLAGPWYGGVALVLAVHLLVITWRAPSSLPDTRPWAVRIFKSSVLHLSILMIMLMLDRT